MEVYLLWKFYGSQKLKKKYELFIKTKNLNTSFYSANINNNNLYNIRIINKTNITLNTT